MKRALVCGAGGFIGSHLVKRLREEGYWVRAVDLKQPEFEPTRADDFILGAQGGIQAGYYDLQNIGGDQQTHQ